MLQVLYMDVAKVDRKNTLGTCQFLGRLKAPVWFWLIDETLSANLVYQNDYEIDSTTPSDKSNDEDHDDGDGMVMIKYLNLKKNKEKNNRLKAKI